MLLADALERRPDATVAGTILSRVPQSTVSLREAAAVAATQALEGLTDDPARRAGALVEQSGRLSELGRREDALTAIDEAVGAYREFAAARPDAFLPNLAMSLNNQSGRLSELGRREDALTAIDEAVGAYRELAAARPDAFLPNLAMSLNNQSTFLSELGRREDALTAIDEALRLVLPVLERAWYVLPDAGLRLVRAYAARCQEAGRQPDAELIARMHAVLDAAGLLGADE
jgi:tetratricopeptide (TPR) repeat protein